MGGLTGVLAIQIGGIQVPDAGPVFLAALALHVLAGGTAVVAGALAATARKAPGRHPRAGTAYLYAIAVVFCTATVMAALRWRHDRHLFLIAVVAAGLAALGWWVRRRRTRRWMAWHGGAMAGSYVALLTGFYVDNGPQLPLWDRLPHPLYWVLPAAVGAPLTWRALLRNGAVRGAVLRHPYRRCRGRPPVRHGCACASRRWEDGRGGWHERAGYRRGLRRGRRGRVRRLQGGPAVGGGAGQADRQQRRRGHRLA